MKEDKIKFGSLTWPLKTSVIASWIVGTFFAVTFLVGFIQGMIVVV